MLILALIILLLPNNASSFDEWSKQDIALEAVSLGLITIDWGQTRDIAARPKRFHEEQNIFLGRHPSESAVNAYFISYLVLHPIITHVLPKKCRPWFQGITIGLEGQAVIHNYSIGLNLRF
jgi:hypothetical protein